MVKLLSSVDCNEIDENETFFVDTNVLCAVHFHTSSWSNNKVNAYSSFLSSLLLKNITLYVSSLSLQEFYHLIEKTERKIYEANNGSISKKDFRRNKVERARIANELQLIHKQIAGQYTLIDDVIDVDDVCNFVNQYTSHAYDPVDFAIVNHHASNCSNFITDDSDFKLDSNITVYSYT
ncbi:hypothetical protein [Selenomonas ruminantium]|uniref:hypothetical protein n=1 Tax=Selenomonas ruminantium TaxID=971 RepID=UPI0026EDE36C|nr:hypothetical protein [Selenomonas ruminantium]